jgi:hypothetical protein
MAHSKLGRKNAEDGGKQMRLYFHETDGGAKYLCSSCVPGTEEGSFQSQYIVRIDGNIRKDAELLVRESAPKIENPAVL